jgi:uncharacterized SAM-binding protein YcdF (DUF218 family)
MTLNYLLWGLFGPAAWPFWVAAFAFLAVIWRRQAVGRLCGKLAAVAGAMTLLLMLTPVGYLMLRPLDMRFAAQDPERVDDIVVLAGSEALAQSTQAGRLEVSAAGERVIEGAALARRFPNARLWIVGGIRGDDGRSDAEWTTNAWERLGVDPARIIAIDTTRDTCGNAEAVSRRIPGAFVLITSAWHLPRAVACFRASGLMPMPWPVDYRTWPTENGRGMWSADLAGNLGRADVALHEWVGLAVYRLRGRTNELFPR